MFEDNLTETAAIKATEVVHFVESVTADISPLVLIPASTLVILVLFITVAKLLRRKKDSTVIEAAFNTPPQTRTEEPEKLTTPPNEMAKAREVPTEESPKEHQEAAEVAAIRSSDQQDWLSRLRAGLSKTRSNINSKLAVIFSSPKAIDAKSLEAIHEVLYRADVGVKAADHLIEALRRKFQGNDSVSQDEVLDSLRTEIHSILETENSQPIDYTSQPHVILVVGVNGVGKTTSIGKLGAHFLAQGKTVLFGAADTFRAAAIEQLNEWGRRLAIDVISHKQDSDPAAVAFDAAKAAKARNSDILIVDTAGRLHSKDELMQELAKIKRVIGKEIPNAPHEVWLVLDATTGQNANIQAKAFKQVVDVTGLIITKLDGTAKGGVVVGISMDQKIPIRHIGVGEKAEDLRAFNAKEFADSIFSANT